MIEKWTFSSLQVPTPYGISSTSAFQSPAIIAPKHYLMQFHPKCPEVRLQAKVEAEFEQWYSSSPTVTRP